MAVDTEASNSTFLRQLTSSDTKTRKDALSALRLYLERGSTFTEIELLKLWKGFFYCMWMTASPLPQHRLAQDLSSLVTQTLARSNMLPFVDAFWRTIAREWANIDSLRLDKYLRLCRLMLYASFDRLKATGFDMEQVEAYKGMMERTALNPDDVKIPNGLRHHVCDIYVDGLEHAQMPKAVMQTLLVPVVHIQQQTKTKSVRKRAGEALTDARLAEWGVEVQGKLGGDQDQQQESLSEDAEFGGFD